MDLVIVVFGPPFRDADNIPPARAVAVGLAGRVYSPKRRCRTLVDGSTGGTVHDGTPDAHLGPPDGGGCGRPGARRLSPGRGRGGRGWRHLRYRAGRGGGHPGPA